MSESDEREPADYLVLRPEILLHPNIPKPLHGLSPRSIFGKEWWDEQRQIAYAKTGYRCAACGVEKKDAKYHKWLEAHEIYEFDYKNGRMIFSEIVALCHSCHNYIHDGRMEQLLISGEITKEKYRDILSHGDAITKNLPPIKAPDEVAQWNKWVLVINGKTYKSKFKNYTEWKKFYLSGANHERI